MDAVLPRRPFCASHRWEHYHRLQPSQARDPWPWRDPGTQQPYPTKSCTDTLVSLCTVPVVLPLYECQDHECSAHLSVLSDPAPSSLLMPCCGSLCSVIMYLNDCDGGETRMLQVTQSVLQLRTFLSFACTLPSIGKIYPPSLACHTLLLPSKALHATHCFCPPKALHATHAPKASFGYPDEMSHSSSRIAKRRILSRPFFVLHCVSHFMSPGLYHR